MDFKVGDWVTVSKTLKVDYHDNGAVMDEGGDWFTPDEGWTIEAAQVPEPDEPTGLGAVVQDKAGMKYVRADTVNPMWLCVTFNSWHRWNELDNVEVLSDGYTG